MITFSMILSLLRSGENHYWFPQSKTDDAPLDINNHPFLKYHYSEKWLNQTKKGLFTKISLILEVIDQLVVEANQLQESLCEKNPEHQWLDDLPFLNENEWLNNAYEQYDMNELEYNEWDVERYGSAYYLDSLTWEDLDDDLEEVIQIWKALVLHISILEEQQHCIDVDDILENPDILPYPIIKSWTHSPDWLSLISGNLSLSEMRCGCQRLYELICEEHADIEKYRESVSRIITGNMPPRPAIPYFVIPKYCSNIYHIDDMEQVDVLEFGNSLIEILGLLNHVHHSLRQEKEFNDEREIEYQDEIRHLEYYHDFYDGIYDDPYDMSGLTSPFMSDDSYTNDDLDDFIRNTHKRDKDVPSDEEVDNMSDVSQDDLEETIVYEHYE